ncbi:MAG: 30S ribosomal protein S8 [Chloroflexi bacterium]|nr:30S ribosomal protein S8 [Chloroflexota bacterium]
MSMSDPIADMLTRVRNASLARHSSVEMPASKVKRAIAEVLRDEGYIDAFEERGEGATRVLRLTLRYAVGTRGRDPVLSGLRRISRPGLRVYTKSDAMPRVYGGLGTAIVSTPRGVMSGDRARRMKVGGEVLAHVW